MERTCSLCWAGCRWSLGLLNPQQYTWRSRKSAFLQVHRNPQEQSLAVHLLSIQLWILPVPVARLPRESTCWGGPRIGEMAWAGVRAASLFPGSWEPFGRNTHWGWKSDSAREVQSWKLVSPSPRLGFPWPCFTRRDVSRNAQQLQWKYRQVPNKCPRQYLMRVFKILGMPFIFSKKACLF